MNKNIYDEDQIKKLVEQAESRIGYLKIVTPKYKNQSEPYRKIFINSNSNVASNVRPITNWTVSFSSL